MKRHVFLHRCVLISLALTGFTMSPGAAAAGALHVRSTDGSEAAVAPPGARLWVDAATTESLEWRSLDDSDSVAAVAGVASWPFTVDAAAKRARLVSTDALREAWERAGALTVTCDGAGDVVLLSRPRRIELDEDGEDFSAPQRSATLVPGSRGFVEVVLDDITRGQVILSIRSADGRTLAETRSVSVGDAVEFHFGGESFALRVERLHNVMIGEDSADLALRRGAAASAKSELEIAAREAERALDEAAGELERADGLVEGKEPTSAVFEAIRRAHEAALRALVPAPPGRLAIGDAGAVFPVNQDSSESVPGSWGRLEVHAGEVTRSAVNLELRTLGGRVVVPSRPLAVGDEMAFRDQGTAYAIRVERLADVFSFIVFTSKDAAELRVIARGGDATDAPEAGGDAKDERGQAPVPVTLAELIRSRITDADAAVALAQALAAEGRVAESRAALDAARRRQAEARNGLRSIVGLFREWNYWRVGDLSIVEARIVTQLPYYPMTASGDAREQAEAGPVSAFSELAASASGRQRLAAEILEARTVGKRYDNRTKMGKRHQQERRDDVIRGGTIVIENSRFETGEKLEPGRDYWLALTPPNAFKAIPRDAGKGVHTQVVFVIPVEK